MKIKGVITGDIIQSTRIKPENKQLVLDTIRNTVYWRFSVGTVSRLLLTIPMKQ